MSQPRILILSEFYRPGFKAGGPIVSLEAIVDSLVERFAITLMTGDRDLGDERPYPDITPDLLLDWGTHRRVYLSPGAPRLRRLRHWIVGGGFDLVYVNSIFSRWF